MSSGVVGIRWVTVRKGESVEMYVLTRASMGEAVARLARIASEEKRDGRILTKRPRLVRMDDVADGCEFYQIVEHA